MYQKNGSLFLSTSVIHHFLFPTAARDFVLLVASGDDLTDEDTFGKMAPPPFDLDQFIRFANMAENPTAWEDSDDKNGKYDDEDDYDEDQD